MPATAVFAGMLAIQGDRKLNSRARNIAVFFSIAVVLAGGRMSAEPVDARELSGPGMLLAGQGDWLWVVSMEGSAGEPGKARLVARRVGEDWSRAMARQLPRISLATARGDRLDVILPNNRHYSYTPDGGGGLRGSMLGSLEPIALAGSGERLIALASRPVARPATRPDGQATSRPAAVHARRSLHLLSQSGGGEWVDVASLPEQLWQAGAASTVIHLGRPVVLAVVGDRLMQAEWLEDKPAEQSAKPADAPPGRWEVRQVRLPDEFSPLADVQVFSINKRVWLVGWPLDGSAPCLGFIEQSRPIGGSNAELAVQQVHRLIIDPGLYLATRHRQWDISASGDRIVVLRSDPKAGAPEVARIDPATAKPEGPWQPVASLKPSDDWLSELLGNNTFILTLFGAMALGFIIRRPSGVVRLPVHVEPAKLGHRLVAFLVDAIPCSLAATLIVYGADVEACQRDMAAALAGQMNTTTMAAPLLFLGLLVVYSAATELLFTATPGKRLMKLAVFSVQGVRPSGGRIVIRNVIKAIEVFFPPLLLTALLLPTRQRIGDLLGGTIVVMPRRSPLPPWTRISDSPPDDNDQTPGSPS